MMNSLLDTARLSGTTLTAAGETRSLPKELVCPICDEREISSAWRLYGVRVCRRCAVHFTRRRRVAFAVDYYVFLAAAYMLLWVVESRFGVVELSEQARNVVGICAGSILFMMRDAWMGVSPGKWLLGCHVVDTRTGRSGGFTASVKRNCLVAIPYVGWLFMLIAFTQMENGPRIGDGWARTKVVWRNHAHTGPFESS